MKIALGFVKGVRTCGITVDSVLDRDIGDWRCIASRYEGKTENIGKHIYFLSNTK